MLSEKEAQKILDHFYVGKIKRLEYQVFYEEAETNQGIFYILEDKPETARDTEKDRVTKLEKLVGHVKRLMLEDYKGDLEDYSSYVHQNNIYYSVYKLEK